MPVLGKISFPLILLMILFIGCKSSKIKTYDYPAPERSVDEIMNFLKKNSKEYNFYTAKISGDVDTDDFGISVGINLWLQKDKYIFSTFKKLNVEAARSYITTDSIFIVNRLQRYYNAENLDYIWNTINLQMPLWQMQDLIVGNQIIPDQSTIQNFERQGNDYQLTFTYDNNIITYTIDGYTSLVKGVKISSLDYGEISASYEYYKSFGGVKRPVKNTIQIVSPDFNATIILNIKDIIWDKDSNIKFTIPTRYERLSL
jgi:hypothetical protein